MSELHLAALNNDVERARKLIKDGVNVNAVDYEGRTALHVGASHGAVEFVEFLCTVSGVDPFLRNRKNQTALQKARGSRRIQKALAQLMDALSSPTRPRAPERLPDDNIEANTMESTDIVNPRVMRKVIAVFVIPFVLLIFINGVFFATKFLLFTAAFYFFVTGYFVSEITIKPPWYHHHPHARELSKKGCPDYWGVMLNDPKTDLGIDYADVTIASTDGYVLSGWHVPSKEKGNTVGVLLVHGGGRDRRTWLRHLPIFHNNGYGALLFDFREHGLSSGNFRGFTFGMKERFDVLSAARFMKDKLGYRTVVAIGTSVGGSSVLMATAMDGTIDAAIAENAITTCAMLQDQIIIDLLGGYFGRSRFSVWLFKVFRLTCSTWLNWRIGNKPSKHCQALHCIASIAPRPVLLMHGTSDTVVPLSHSQTLFAAASEPKEIWICEGAFHCGLYNKDPQEFERRVVSFLQRIGSQRP
jgi:alpha-beta hydrolase superfamily lysophospholipase